jgi:predicted nucleic acid-binding protein
MTKTLVNLDDDQLATAQAAWGTATKKDTVNRALHESMRVHAIRQVVLATDTDDGLVLADVSALVYCTRAAVLARLLPLVVTDRLATCAAVEHELLRLADEATDPAVAALHRVPLRWLATDDADLRRAAQVQAELIRQGLRHLAWQRLVIAAVGERQDAAILHHTDEYDLIAKVTGQRIEWVDVTGSDAGHHP